MFNSIAKDYDRLNHIMSLGIDKIWRKRGIRAVFEPSEVEKELTASGESENGGLHILDIACGTGDFSIAIAKEMARRYKSRKIAVPEEPGPNRKEHTWVGHVTGVDLSEGMLAVMDEKVKKAGLEKLISHETGDSEHLRFEDNSFDRITIAFGIRNFENREACLKELLRILRPGGRLVILELSVPSNAVIRWCYNLYFLHVLPYIGGKISGDTAAYRYLPASVLGFPNKSRFMKLMKDCGYVKVRHKAFTLGICRMYLGEKSGDLS